MSDDVDSGLDDTEPNKVPVRFYAERDLTEQRRKLKLSRQTRLRARDKYQEAQMVLAASGTVFNELKPPKGFLEMPLTQQIALAKGSGEQTTRAYADLLSAYGGHLTAEVDYAAADAKHKQLKGDLKGMLVTNEVLSRTAQNQAYPSIASGAASALSGGAAAVAPLLGGGGFGQQQLGFGQQQQQQLAAGGFGGAAAVPTIAGGVVPLAIEPPQ